MNNKNIVRYFFALPKFLLGFVGTLAFRLISPFLGLWNVSPLMATELAGSKIFGPWVGGLYGAFSIYILDLLMGKVGLWTVITSVTYGLVGVLGYLFLKNRKVSASNFIIASIAGTLLFDFVTGILMGPIMFDQLWSEAIIGQIPFTLRHLIGNIFFASVLAPWFYKKILENPKFQLDVVFGYGQK
jgi:uncharacterized membrane protein